MFRVFDLLESDTVSCVVTLESLILPSTRIKEFESRFFFAGSTAEQKMHESKMRKSSFMSDPAKRKKSNRNARNRRSQPNRSNSHLMSPVPLLRFRLFR